jgi:tRNA 2-selenouridine synthase
MPQIIGVEEFLQKAHSLPVIDVRAPKEFSQGHIPGAHNIHLLDDKEREVIGTLYKHEGQQSAIMKGLEFAGPKLTWYVQSAFDLNPDGEVLVHCWRGGLRSRSFCQFLEMANIKCYLLDGGYKNYRHHIREAYTKAQKIYVLGGMTGSGKTEILHKMEEQGAQVIDLEGCAHHKGSAFGAIGQKEQPTTEQFENECSARWLTFDMSKPIWLEDESRKVGKVVINETLFDRMREAPLIAIDMPQQVRAKRLEREYCIVPSETLIEIVYRITRRLGGDRAKECAQAFENGEYERAIIMLLDYYDKGYAFGMGKRDQQRVFHIEVGEDDPSKTAAMLIEYINKR